MCVSLHLILANRQFHEFKCNDNFPFSNSTEPERWADVIIYQHVPAVICKRAAHVSIRVSEKVRSKLSRQFFPPFRKVQRCCESVVAAAP